MRIVTYILAVIGFFAVASIFLVILVASHFTHRQPTLPDRSILALTIDGSFEEKPGFDPFKLNHQMSLSEAVTAIESGAEDSRIQGLFVQFADNIPLTQAQELHKAVQLFRAKGKTAYAFADTFGEGDSGGGSYYLASAFDKIWLQPMGSVGLMGIASEQPFLKNALNRNGIDFQISKREQYKTAFDNLTETGFTAANREMIESLLGDLMQQLNDGIAQDRKLESAAVHHAMDNGPLSASQAKEDGLIDVIDYRDKALAELEGKAATSQTLSVRRYLDNLPETPAKGKIALIYTVGELSRSSSNSPLSGDEVSHPREVWNAFRQASEDPDVKAIVFRINSPGGSVVASETIRSGVLLAKSAGKPIIVSMGEMAGSGGYWIAADADKIFADPATLTGSIGVIGGKPVLQGLLEDHGVVTDQIALGQNANMNSIFRPFSPEQQAKQDAMLDEIYAHFKTVVAEGRKLSPEKVEDIAKGRVWTGKQAKEIGLIDELGGLKDAIAAAKEAGGFTAATPVNVEEIPREPTPAEILRTLFMNKDDDEEGQVLLGSHIAEKLKFLASLKSLLAPLLATPGQETVKMQPLPLDQ